MVRAPVLLPLLLLPCAGSAQAPGPLPEPRTIEGRIADVLGDPIPAAEVHVLAGGRVVGRTRADGEGVYCIPVPDGAELRFLAADKATARRPWRGNAGARVHNVVLEDGTTLRGRVRDADGAPVANAAVVALPPPRLDAMTAVTGDDGVFELRGVPLRPLYVRVVADCGWTQTFLRVTAPTELELTLRDAARLCAVRVHGLPPAAVAGATLRIYGGDLSAVQNGGRVPLRADGTARLLLQQDCLVDAIAPGVALAPEARYVTPEARRIEFAVAGAAEAAATTRLRGTVRSSTDRPVAELRVLVRDRSHCELGSVVADRDGAFALRVERPLDGFVRLGIEIGEWMPLADELTLLDGCAWVPHPYSGDAAALLVERTGTVRSTLHADGGEGFVLADVVAWDAERSARRELRAHTDRTGNLALALPPGRHELLAVGHDGAVRTAHVDVDAGEVVEPRWQRLATGTVVGVVRDRDGNPVPGVELFLLCDPNAPPSARDHCRVVTNRDGRFRCRGLPEGDWAVTPTNDSRFEATAVAVRAGGETTAAIELAR